MKTISKHRILKMLSVAMLAIVLLTGSFAKSTDAASTGISHVKGGVWLPVPNVGGAFYYVTADGAIHSNCFTEDGYYVEANGIRFLGKSILGATVVMRNSWLTAAEAGNFDCFLGNANAIRSKLASSLKQYRKLTVYNNNIRLTSMAQDGDSSYMVDRLGLYKNSDINGYSIMVGTSLGGDRKTIGQGVGDVDLIAYYDYDVLRFFTNSISRSGDLVASAIYSHWQDTNEYGLRIGQWVTVGDTMIRYMPSTGQGLYEIRAAF